MLYPRYQYQLDYDIVITQEDINAMYLIWDTDDVRSNVAYNYEIVDPLTGGSAFDRRVDLLRGISNEKWIFPIILKPSFQICKMTIPYSFLRDGQTGWLWVYSYFI